MRIVTKRPENRFLTIVLIFTVLAVVLALPLGAQGTLEVIIQSGSSTTTCTDNFGSPDPRFRVNVANTGWETYPATTFCFNDLPNTQFQNAYNCPADVPDVINVCFRAFEDDGAFCNVNEDCSETICQDFVVPAPGNSLDYTLELPDNLSSDGEVSFTIALDDNFIGGLYDFVCDAVELGELPNFGIVGDGSLSNYSNLCATNTNDPNPSDDGGFGNDRGVWFTFTTNSNPSAYHFINGFSDPENLGDPVGLQIALYTSDDGTCTGNLEYVASAHNTSSLDQVLNAHCLDPDTRYFILVDGAYLPGTGVDIDGYFGLEILVPDIVEGQDFRCNAEDLGMVPDGGSVGTPLNQTNYCATEIGEWDPSAFQLQQTVWYLFQAPNTGHVIIDAISDQPQPFGIDPVDLQVALYYSGSNNCVGPLFEVESQYTSSENDESIQVQCLEPGLNYWIQIDGSGNNTLGVFSITVTDGGPVPPQGITALNEVLCAGSTLQVGDSLYTESGSIFQVIDAYNGCDSLITGSVTILPPLELEQNPVICDGETFGVGNSIYASTGTYVDVLSSVDGCDSTVTTNLTVLEGVEAVAFQLQAASSQLASDGSATVTVTSGTGPFSYLWSNNATTQTIDNLSPGLYCVTVTAANGCEDVTCISVLYPGAIAVDVTNGSATCNGGVDGSLTLNVSAGMPSYAYSWGVNFGPPLGNGVINVDGGSATINNLAPASNYTITVTDASGFIVVTFGEVINPAPLVTVLDTTLCFGETLVVGATTYTSSGPINENILSSAGCDSLVTGMVTVLEQINTVLDETLCFGENLTVGSTVYTASGPINETLTAANGCDSLVSGMLVVLDEIAMTIDTTLCFGESIEVAGNVYASTGNFTDILPAANGCDSIISTTLVVLNELTVDAQLASEASGYNQSDGVGLAVAGGGDGNYTYLWSNTASTAQATGLTGGLNYCVTVTDGTGCTAEDCLTVFFPVNIQSLFLNDTLDCVGNVDGQLIFSAFNGQAPYDYSWQNATNTLNGNGVIANEGGQALLGGLPAGNYTVTITDPWGDGVFSLSVVDPEPIVISMDNFLNASCFGECDGALSVSVIGGNPPYTFNWSGTTQNSAIVNDLCAGDHFVTVTDANGCSEIWAGNLIEPYEFIVEANVVDNVSCNGGDNGMAVVTTNGFPIAYDWSDSPSEGDVATDLTAGIYTVTVTNTNNCTAVASVEILEPLQSINVDIEIAQEILCSGEDSGALFAQVSGGVGNYNYQWDHGATEAATAELPAGLYNLTVLDENNCEGEASIVLQEPTPVAASFTAVDINCFEGEQSGRILVDTITGGTSDYLLSLDGITYFTTEEFTNLSAGAYNVYVEDANGCVSDFPVEVYSPDAIFVNLGPDETIILGDSIRLNAETTSDDPTFVWQSSEALGCADCPSIWARPAEVALYQVTVIDTLTGCTATDEVTIFVEKNRDVYIPNAFTPNFDGENDVFRIYGGPAVARVQNFQVFDRWGALVYRADEILPGEDTGWDGTFKGKVMDSGVYIYFADIQFLDGEEIRFKGDVTLME